MSDYTIQTDFAAKDSLATGNPSKQVRGYELDAEFNAIATAINSKADSASPTFTGTTTMAAATATTVTATGLVTAPQIKFSDPTLVVAYAAADQTSGAVGAQISFATEASDLSADFASGVFTAPYDGVYAFNICITVGNTSGSSQDTYFYLQHVSGAFLLANSTRDTLANNKTGGYVISLVCYLAAGATVEVRNGGTALSASYKVNSGRGTTFSATLLHRV